MPNNRVVVIGGGHAGVEAAYASARLGVDTVLVSLRREGIGQMSCNPAIGGLGKGHLVKEVDALGGLMGRAIDATGIQFRILNASKGAAVRASRAQADRDLYKKWVQGYLESTPHLTIVEGEAAEILVAAGTVLGVRLKDNSEISAASVVVTTGTFLKGLMHTGAEQTHGGRLGDCAATHLSESLKALGFPLGRLKTGTPPRLRKSSIDFSKLQEQPGDDPPQPFSYMTDRIVQSQISCWMTSTNENVHDLIRSNRERSPMFNGQIRSGGPRYCPSLEDKVFRFAEKTSHSVFLEPEGRESDIVYPNGISTSLPRDIQERFVRMMPGLEHVEILQFGYAVEYDFVDPRSVGLTYETKNVNGLFFAGQINGTSGYEEAAAQGIVAGANAALRLINREPLLIDRSMGYIGVMTDDLTTSGVDEPYRMFTSRAEYRLTLREDNAALRLSPLGERLGLLNQAQIQRFNQRNEKLSRGRIWSNSYRIKPTEIVNSWLSDNCSSPLKDSITIAQLTRRPEMTLEKILSVVSYEEVLEPELIAALEVELKFEGYLARQEDEVRNLRKIESQVIPTEFSYDSIPTLRTEAREKLKKVRPYSLGQALRIPGMTPSTVALLAVHLKRFAELKENRPASFTGK